MLDFTTLSVKKIPLHLLFWLGTLGFFYAFFSSGTENLNFIFWFAITLSTITIISTYIFIYNLIPNYLIAKKYWLFLLYTLYAFIFISFAVSLTIISGLILFFKLNFKEMPHYTVSTSVILVCVCLIISLVSGIKILKINFQSLEEKKDIETKFLQTQLQLKEQELKYLKMQIHPHFLFNTLNTLYGFALKKSESAPDMILKLSNLLDYILYQVEKPKVLLINETQHIEDYITLEKMRFQDTLRVSFQQDVHEQSTLIPPMIFLPFVENAFKHGSLTNGILQIHIKLQSTANTITFVIANSYKHTTKFNHGIGLTNIKKRLTMLFENNFSLETSTVNNSYKVTLKITTKNE